VAGAPLAAQLQRLMAALTPWLLEGAPQHYQQAGVRLFRDRESRQLWLQRSATPRNPYGAGATEAVAWPNPTKTTRDPTAVPAVTNDPHAGHQH
jgi:Cu(I)/Ag(I) efflux system membrane fusion protein